MAATRAASSSHPNSADSRLACLPMWRALLPCALARLALLCVREAPGTQRPRADLILLHMALALIPVGDGEIVEARQKRRFPLLQSESCQRLAYCVIMLIGQGDKPGVVQQIRTGQSPIGDIAWRPGLGQTLLKTLQRRLQPGFGQALAGFDQPLLPGITTGLLGSRSGTAGWRLQPLPGHIVHKRSAVIESQRFNVG